MIGNLKPLEIVLIIAVILLLFGAKKLPDMARSLGKSARILKSEAKAMKRDDAEPAAPTTETVADPAPCGSGPYHPGRAGRRHQLPSRRRAQAHHPELTADPLHRQPTHETREVGCSSLPASRRRTTRGGCPSSITCVSCVTGF